MGDGFGKVKRGREIPDDVPPTGFLGVMRRPDGAYSTELNIGVDDPRLNNGRPTNIPSLVPGQVDVEGLLSGPVHQPSQAQQQRAIEFALKRVQHGATFPSFDSFDAADAGAARRHKRIETIRGEVGPDGLPLETPTIFDREGNDLRKK